MTAPYEHLYESQKLEADSLIDLYEISLKNVSSPTYVRFRDGPPGKQTSYRGALYDHLPVKFSGYQRSADSEHSRPTLTAVNPFGVFNSFAINGNFDGAFLTRYQVLLPHLEQNIGIFQTEIWFVARVTQVITNQGITLELRGLADGPEQLLPVRKYMPDAGFPFVSLR